LTYDDCQTLLGFLRSAFPRLTEDQIDFYSEMLITENAQDASTAILQGVSFWKHPPSWAEIKEAIRAVRARRPKPEPEEEAVYVSGLEMPEWIKRWLYARFVASPPDLRVFKEQQGVAPDVTPREGWMPEDAWVEEAKTVTAAQVRQLMKAYMEVGA
jgi:hypothetical protein